MQIDVSELALLLFQIGVVLVASRLFGVALRWMKQPLVVAEIMAGIALGPSLLGWLLPATSSALFPSASLDNLKVLSQIGLILFMFLVGLELDPKLLQNRARASVMISHASIVVPFALGSGAAFWLWPDYSSPGVSFVSFLLFLGAGMSVTAFPVLARILTERGLLHSHVGSIAIACAAVDDVTSWCILAFAVAVAHAHGFSPALWTVGFTLAFVVLMWWGLRPLLARISQWLAKRARPTSAVVATTILMVMLCSSITEMIGIHALFGAFLFGAIFPKEGGWAEMLTHKLETIAVVLFLPLFFAFSGLRTQIGLIDGSQEWLLTVVIIGLATLGKFGGSAVTARLTGLRWREASAIGILMNTRGLMELIVLNIGLDLHIISPTLFTMMVIMALVTTVATTPVLEWVYPDRELRRDLDVRTAITVDPATSAVAQNWTP